MKSSKILLWLTLLTIIASIFVSIEFSVVYASELEEPVKEYKFYKDWRVWAAVITTVVATVAVILIFKRGGGDDGSSSSGGSTEGLKEVLKPDTQQTSTNLSVELPQNLTKSTESSVVNKTLEVATDISKSNAISQNAVVDKVLDSAAKVQESNVISQDSVLNTTVEVGLKVSESSPEIINVISQNAAEIATAAATVVTFKLYGVETPITVDPEYSAEVLTYISGEKRLPDLFFLPPYLEFAELIANLTNITTFFEYRFPQSHPLYHYQLRSKAHWTYLIDKISTQGIQDKGRLADYAMELAEDLKLDSFMKELGVIFRDQFYSVFKSITELFHTFKFGIWDKVDLAFRTRHTKMYELATNFYLELFREHTGGEYDKFWAKNIIFDHWMEFLYKALLLLFNALKELNNTVGINKIFFVCALEKVLFKVTDPISKGGSIPANIKEVEEDFEKFRRNNPLENNKIHDKFSSAITRLNLLVKEFFTRRK